MIMNVESLGFRLAFQMLFLSISTLFSLAQFFKLSWLCIGLISVNRHNLLSVKCF